MTDTAFVILNLAYGIFDEASLNSTMYPNRSHPPRHNNCKYEDLKKENCTRRIELYIVT